MQGITAITFDGAGGGGEIIISCRKAQPNPVPARPAPRRDRQGCSRSESLASPEATSSATGTLPPSSPARAMRGSHASEGAASRFLEVSQGHDSKPQSASG